ncbi:MAG: hypothetical protein QM779_11695 [Propionicimonas sp.]|uniref:hypothetical protein n=1 Tax=Propionicimonas sp. TaxID=1955623 RepID=UPI003D0C8C36
MSVETALGVSSQTAHQLQTDRWPDWSRQCTAMAKVGCTDVRGWLRPAAGPNGQRALYELAVLAAADGGDDVDAAKLLCWAMLPAACRVANELSDLDPDIDAFVASQLWIEVRTFNWRASNQVAGTLSASLRRSLLRESGIGAPRQPELDDAPWPVLLERLAREPANEHLDSREVLLRVLDWGVESGTIQPADRALLLDMVDASHADPRRRSPRRVLFGTSSLLGPGLGITARSVRRRGRRALDALAAHASELTEFLDPLAS